VQHAEDMPGARIAPGKGNPEILGLEENNIHEEQKALEYPIPDWNQRNCNIADADGLFSVGSPLRST
jgi:hypothetical protein